jgi:hypothetical protein
VEQISTKLLLGFKGLVNNDSQSFDAHSETTDAEMMWWLQVSVCAGANRMEFWASLFSGVTAGLVFIKLHYFMLWCKGQQ